MEKENKVTYKKDAKLITELTDIPFKNYKILTQPGVGNKKIVEEVYLYLSDFNKSTNSSSALYMSSIPLSPNQSKLTFCNDYFVSTYGINHVMTGTWERKDNTIRVNLNDKTTSLALVGQTIIDSNNKSKLIEFTLVSHPKPLDEKIDNSNVFKRTNMIAFKDVFEIDPNNESNDSLNISGIRFYQNKSRDLIHPNWNKPELKKDFSYEKMANYYRENLDSLKIKEVFIEVNEEHSVYFKINNSALQSQKKHIIRYKK
jgi:hypothetical protein